MVARLAKQYSGVRWMPACLCLLLAAPQAAHGQGIRAALLPFSQAVLPDSTFDIEIDVTQAGSAFNGFETVVSFDPSAITFLQASPVSLQQGCLMTGDCSTACGNTFHVFAAAGDSLKVNDGLLCDQISLTGPGQIYKLHFRASSTPQVTAISFRRGAFFNAGLFVTPLTLSGCTVTISSPVDVGPRSSVPRLGVRARPNPFRGVVHLSVEADVEGEQELRVIDMLGRTVRRLPAGWFEVGTRQVEWDGRSEVGTRVPAGIYLVRLRQGDRVRQTRVTVLW